MIKLSFFWRFTIFATLLRLALAAALPITRDESYYVAWAQHLAWGYLDHPPLVALSALTGQIGGFEHGTLHALTARLGTIALGLCTLFVFWNLAKKIFPENERQSKIALILSQFSLVGLVGFLITPDTAMALPWILGLHEAHAALSGQNKRWLSAGFAAGMGLLAKYQMILLPLTFLVSLCLSRRDQLKTRWPYLGLGVAALIFLPHICWNANNQWITMRFQIARGFDEDRSKIVQPLLDPIAFATPLSPEFLQGLQFSKLDPPPEISDEEEEDEESGDQEETTSEKILRSLSSFSEYWAGEAALWGALLIPVVGVVWHRRRRFFPQSAELISPTAPTGTTRSLLWSATLVPLGFFGLLAPFTHIEANWPAMYVFSGALLLAPYLGRYQKMLLVTSAINVSLCLVLVFQALIPSFGAVFRDNRILNETAGFESLGDFVLRENTAKKLPVFADNYQTTAMLRFYQPTLKGMQWPGFTRPSEFTRNPLFYMDYFNGCAFPTPLKDCLKAGAAFVMVTQEPFPPHVNGYEIVKLTQIRVCKDSSFQTIAMSDVMQTEGACTNDIRRWFAAEYRFVSRM